MEKHLEITDYYGNEIVVKANYTEVKETQDITSPDDPSEIEIISIFLIDEDNSYNETDKFDVDEISRICMELCDFGEEKITLSLRDSNSIKNTEKYLSIDEGKMIENLIRSEAGIVGNSNTKNNTLFLIAKKCKVIGIDQEFIEEMDENFKAKY